MMAVLCCPMESLSDGGSVFFEKNNALSLISQVETAYAEYSEIGLYTPSQKEIANYYVSKNLAALSSETVYSYESAPNLLAPYTPEGLLSDGNLTDALNTVKFIRYISGVSDNIYISSRYSTYAQQTAMISYANNCISHTPVIPENMNLMLANQAAENCAKCNLAKYYAPDVSLNHVIIDGWMDDSDPNNISVLGHRRWILNPNLSTTGFGVVTDSVSTYASMYVHGTGNFDSSQTFVCWPAKNMPASMFKGNSAWSISVGQPMDISKISVSLINQNTYEIWRFSEKESDGLFYVDNGDYGLEGCIIFRPDNIESYKPGDSYYVVISGLSDDELFYTVDFFDPEGYFALSSPTITKLKLNSENKPSITWSKVTGAEKYNLYRKAGNGSWKLLKSNLTSTSYDDSSAGPGIKYSYAVSSVNMVSSSAFESALSPDKNVSTALSKVSFTSLTAPKKKRNQLKWKSVEKATGYKVYRRVYGTTKWTLVKTTSSLSYANTAVTSKKTYQYRIRAYRTMNGVTIYGPYSTIKKIKTK